MAGPGIETPAKSPPRPAIWVFAVLLVSFALYAPSVGNDFTWDDRPAAMGHNGATRNPLVAELRPLSEYFTSNYWPAHAPASRSYRPLTVMTFALRHAVVGDQASVAHLINVLLHVLAVGLGIALLLALGCSWPAACLGGLVFGVHAIHSEAVANVVGRAELLAFCCGAGSALALHRARHRVLLYPVAAALLFCACHAKESAVAWAVFAPLTVVLRQRDGWSGRRLVATAATVAVPTLIYLAMRSHVLSLLPAAGDGAVGYLENPLLDASHFTRWCTGTLAWGYGLLLCLLPFRLAADYGPHNLPVVTGPGDPWVVASLLAAGGLIALLFWGVRRLRRGDILPLVGVACFGGFSFVVTNIPVPVFMLFAERTYYTPSLGVAVVLAWGVDRARRSGRVRPLATLALGVWVGASALVVVQRNGVWRDDETLILSEVRTNPVSVRMQLCAGDLYAGRGEVAAARRHFREAVRLDARAPQGWLELGRLELGAGDAAAARDALERALQGREPDAGRLAAEVRELLRKARRPAAEPGRAGPGGAEPGGAGPR